MDDDAVYGAIAICTNNFFSERVVAGDAIIDNLDANIFTVTFFEINVFGDDGIIRVAEDEEFGFYGYSGDLVCLAFLNKAGELFTI